MAMNTFNRVQGQAPMPLFQNEATNAFDGESKDPTGEGDYEKTRNKKETNNDKMMFAAAIGGDYASVPYPIIIGPGAAGPVLPKHWCPQAKLQDGPLKGRTFSAGSGASGKKKAGRSPQWLQAFSFLQK